MLISYLPYYVGKGSKTRVTDHYRNSCDDNLHTKNKILKLKNGGFSPMYIKYNENSSEDDAFTEEINAINYIKNNLGDVLTNMSDGGDNPPVHMGGSNINAVYVCRYSSITGEFLDEWDSAADACRYLNLSTDMSKHITQCCRGNRHTAGGYIWRFDKVDKLELKDRKYKRIPFTKLIAYNDNEYKVFSSMKEAYDFLETKNKGKINLAILGKIKSYKGYFWKIEVN